MAKVSISEAARLVGLSRQQLYRRHLGDDVELSKRLSVERDEAGGAVYVDTSELLRVFKSLKIPGDQATAGPEPVLPVSTVNVDRSAEVELLREQLAAAADREEWHRKHAGELAGGLRLLEDKSREVSEVVKADSALIAELKKQVKRLEAELAQSRKVNKELREALKAEQNRGIFARLTGR